MGQHLCEGIDGNKDAILSLNNEAGGIGGFSTGYKASKTGTYFTGILGTYTKTLGGDPEVWSAPQYFAIHVRDDVPQIEATQSVKNLDTNKTESNGVIDANPGETLESTSTFIQTNPDGDVSELNKPSVKTIAPDGATVKKNTTSLEITNKQTGKTDTINVPDSAWSNGSLIYDFTSYAKANGGGVDVGGMKGEFTYKLVYDYFFDESHAGTTDICNAAAIQGYLSDDGGKTFDDGPNAFATTNLGTINLGKTVKKMAPEITSISTDTLDMLDNTSGEVYTSWIDYDSDEVQFYTSTNGGAPVEYDDAQDNSDMGNMKKITVRIFGADLKLGENKVEIYAVDSDNLKSNVKTITVNVTKSNEAPELTITDQATELDPKEIPVTDDYVLNGTWSDKDSSSVTLSYMLNDNEPVTFASDVANENPGKDNQYTTTISKDDLIAGSINVLTVVATDSDGSVSQQVTYIKTVYQKPTVTIDKTEYSVKKGDATLAVSGTFTDNDSDRVRMYYQIDGGTAQPLTDWQPNSPLANSHKWNGNVDVSGMTKDAKLTVYVVDDQLQSESVNANLKYVVNTPPVILDANNEEGGTAFYSVVQGQSFNLTGHFKDQESKSVDIYASTPAMDEKVKIGTKNSAVNITAVDSDGAEAANSAIAIFDYQSAAPKFAQVDNMAFGTLKIGEEADAEEFIATVSSGTANFQVQVQQSDPFDNGDMKFDQFITYNGKPIDETTNIGFAVTDDKTIYQADNKFKLAVPTDALIGNDYKTTVTWTLTDAPK